MKRTHLSWLVGLLSLTTACGGSTPAPATHDPWAGATPLADYEDAPSGVAIAGTDVVYTTGRTVAGENAVRIAPLDPASPAASRVLVANPGGVGPNGPLAVDGGDLYVAAGAGIMRISIATGVVTPVVSGRPTEVLSLVVDDRFVWWTTSGYRAPQSDEVARIPKAGGAVEILASGADDKGRVADDDPVRKAVAVSHPFFYSIVPDGDTALASAPDGLLRVAVGRPPELVLDTNKAFDGALSRITGDTDHIYGEIAGGHDQLISVPRAGGVPVTLARDVDNVNRIVVAGGEVIFFTSGGGSDGKENINAVSTTGGPVRVVTSGHYADGDIAVAGDRVVFSGDRRVWSAPLHGS